MNDTVQRITIGKAISRIGISTKRKSYTQGMIRRPITQMRAREPMLRWPSKSTLSPSALPSSYSSSSTASVASIASQGAYEIKLFKKIINERRSQSYRPSFQLIRKDPKFRTPTRTSSLETMIRRYERFLCLKVWVAMHRVQATCIQSNLRFLQAISMCKTVTSPCSKNGNG